MPSKKKEKTLDELLEEALVSEDEYLFEEALNSIWVKTNYIIDVRDGTHDTPKYVEEGIPLITSKNLKNGEIDFSTAKFITKEDHENIAKRSGVDLNDILFAMIGTIGNPVLITKEEEFSIKNVALFKENESICLAKYFYYFIQSPYYEKYLEMNKKGSTQKFIPLNVFRNAPLYLPPIQEQYRIIDKIEGLFFKIDKAQQLIEEAKEKTLLGKAIYFKNTLAGKDLSNNEQWEVLKIEALVMPTRKSMTTGPFGTSLKKTDYVSEGIPVLGIDNINNGEFIYKNKNFITEDKLKELTSFLVEEDDVIISRSGTVGELCIVPKKIPPAIISTNIIKLTLNKEIILPQFFVYMFLVEGTVKEQIRDLCKGSTREFLNQTILKSIEFPVPSIAEQEIIIEKMKAAINRFNKIEDFIYEKSLGFDKLKRSILSKAFKGELGTSDSNDEPAIELLKSILQEKL